MKKKIFVKTLIFTFLVLSQILIPSPSFALENNKNNYRERFFAKVKTLGIKGENVSIIYSTVSTIKDQRIIKYAEIKINEGLFKRKHPEVILKRVQRFIENAKWTKSFISECFNPSRPTLTSFAVYYTTLALDSGLGKDMFEHLCRNFKKKKITHLSDYVNFVKMGISFSRNNIPFSAVTELMKEVNWKRFSHFHFLALGEMTILGVRQGMNPYRAIEEVKKFININNPGRKKVLPVRLGR